jgi:hypothetical protein
MFNVLCCVVLEENDAIILQYWLFVKLHLTVKCAVNSGAMWHGMIKHKPLMGEAR